MKRIAAVTFLIAWSAFWPMPAKAQGTGVAKYAQQSREADKRAAKQQRKAMKKYLKAQRKAAKKVHRHAR